MKARILVPLLVLSGTAALFTGTSTEAAPTSELRINYYRSPSDTLPCGDKIRTCQFQTILSGCALETPPPPYTQTFHDPCF
jgi:hypothetical protein